jgi:hypothetical protein
MQMLQEIAIHRVLADPAANYRERKQKEHAVIAEMDQHATLRKCFDPMGGGVVPGKLRGFLDRRRIGVSEIKIVPLLRQFIGEAIFRSLMKFFGPVWRWMDGVVFFIGWRCDGGRCADAIIAVLRSRIPRPLRRCSAFRGGTKQNRPRNPCQLKTSGPGFH